MCPTCGYVAEQSSSAGLWVLGVLVLSFLVGSVFMWASSYYIKDMRPSGRDYQATIVPRFGEPFQVRGDCTVWHRFPSGKRMSLEYEVNLTNAWKAAEWKRGR